MQSFADAQRSLLSRNNPAYWFSPRIYDAKEKLYVLKDSVIGFGFQFFPTTGAPDKVAQEIAKTINNKGVPDNTNMVITLYASEDVTDHLLYKMKRAENISHDLPRETREVIAEAANYEIEHIKGCVNKQIESINGTTARNTVGWITFSFPIPQDGRKKNKSLKSVKFEEFKETILEFRTRVSAILKNHYLAPENMTPQVMLNLTSPVLNTSDSAAWRSKINPYEPEEFIDNQFVEGSTDIDRTDEEFFYIGSSSKPRFWKALTQKRFPAYVSLATVMSYMGDIGDPSKFLPGNSLITLNVFFPEQQSMKNEVTFQKGTAFVQQKFGDNYAKQYEDLGKLENLMKENHKVVRVLFSVIVSGNDKAECTNNSAEAIGHFSSLNIDLIEDGALTPSIFFTAMPFGGATDTRTIDFFNRYKKMTIGQALKFMPISAQWKGVGIPEMTLYSRNGELMNLDVFSQDSYSGCTFGKTGKGKSVLNNYVLFSNIAAGAQAWVVDLGDSYKNHCNVLGGNYYDFSDASQFNFDPLSKLAGLKDEDLKDQLDMIVGVLSKMIVVNDYLDDYSMMTIRRAARTVIEVYGKESRIPLVAEELKKHEHVQIQKLGEQLEEFYKQYEEYFTGENKVDLGEGFFNVIELFNLKSKPHLAKVILFITIMAIERETFYAMRDPIKKKRKKMVLLDEAWQFILGDTSTGGRADEAVMSFMSGAYRQFRKSKAGMWLIMQSLFDLYSNPSARPIIDNSAFKLMLEQDNEPLNQLRNEGKLDFNDYEFELIKSVESQKGVYSEIFIQAGSQKGVGRLVMNKYMLKMFTTDPDEKTQLDELIASGLSTREAIHVAIGDKKIQSNYEGPISINIQRA